jgi:methylmalonyl-CoA mutase, N-terminal domain
VKKPAFDHPEKALMTPHTSHRRCIFIQIKAVVLNCRQLSNVIYLLDECHGWYGQTNFLNFPFTRGIHPTGYRGRLWTMRMFAGFGTAEDTNERFKYLLAPADRALASPSTCRPSTATTRRPEALGEFGTCGVAVSAWPTWRCCSTASRSARHQHLDDDQRPAAMIWAMYIAAPRSRACPAPKLARHAPERHPQGVHRPEGVHLPAAPSMRW